MAKGGFSRYQSYTVQKRRRERLFSILFFLLLIYAGYLIMESSFLRTYRFDSDTMSPTIEPRTSILVTPLPLGQAKLPFLPFGLPGWRGPLRGEVVVVIPPSHKASAPWSRVVDDFVRFVTLNLVSLDSAGRPGWDGAFTLRRVIGLPGDSIRIQDDQVSVKPAGAKYYLSEYEVSVRPYSIDQQSLPPDWRSTFPGGKALVERVLGPDEYFVMADRRGLVGDSLTWGPVRRNDIQAVALLKYWPLSQFGGL